MEIHGFNKTTLLDYPEHVACTVFTGHCNMRCPFCHNGDLVLMPGSQPTVDVEEFFAFLNKRKNILEGVAITGGEPTLNPALFLEALECVQHKFPYTNVLLLTNHFLLLPLSISPSFKSFPCQLQLSHPPTTLLIFLMQIDF